MSALCAALASSLLSSAVTTDELIAQARKVANTGDAAGADALLVQAHELSPTLAEPLMLRGNVAAFLKRDASAAEELYKASLALEQRWDAYYFLGKTRAGQQKWEPAAEAFEAAAKLNPTNAAPLTDLGIVWTQAGSWERVHDAYRRAAATDLHSEGFSTWPAAAAGPPRRHGAPTATRPRCTRGTRQPCSSTHGSPRPTGGRRGGRGAGVRPARRGGGSSQARAAAAKSPLGMPASAGQGGCWRHGRLGGRAGGGGGAEGGAAWHADAVLRWRRVRPSGRRSDGCGCVGETVRMAVAPSKAKEARAASRRGDELELIGTRRRRQRRWR